MILHFKGLFSYVILPAVAWLKKKISSFLTFVICMAAVSFLQFFQLANKSASFCIQLQQMPMNFLAFALARGFVCGWSCGHGDVPGDSDWWAGDARGDGVVLSLWRGTKLSASRMSLAASGFPPSLSMPHSTSLIPRVPIQIPSLTLFFLPRSFIPLIQRRWHF